MDGEEPKEPVYSEFKVEVGLVDQLKQFLLSEDMSMDLPSLLFSFFVQS